MTSHCATQTRGGRASGSRGRELAGRTFLLADTPGAHHEAAKRYATPRTDSRGNRDHGGIRLVNVNLGGSRTHTHTHTHSTHTAHKHRRTCVVG
ncbi:hypothetical protein EYF80_062945 [Liparis tanakae]|uniref:Uncharacterized protein n=1 Tax=Liparis tanakae TaxID=230148 RepID=A0A4Z2EDW4_9TELE|nr:hypothetical protein EYF80_062945 [Liparis tanakae]